MVNNSFIRKRKQNNTSLIYTRLVQPKPKPTKKKVKEETASEEVKSKTDETVDVVVDSLPKKKTKKVDESE